MAWGIWLLNLEGSRKGGGGGGRGAEGGECITTGVGAASSLLFSSRLPEMALEIRSYQTAVCQVLQEQPRGSEKEHSPAKCTSTTEYGPAAKVDIL